MQEYDYGEAVTAFAWANELDHRRVQHGQLAGQALRVWREAVRHRLPASRYFPRLDLGLPAPRFKHLTREFEREMIGLKVTQDLLDDPTMKRQWWHELQLEPNRRPDGLPDVLRVDFRWPQVGHETNA